MRGKYTNLSPRFRPTRSPHPVRPVVCQRAHFVFYTLPVKHPIKTGLLALENLQGQSFTGRQLKDAKGHPIEAGDPRTVLIALNTIAESFVPFLRHGRQIREKGGSPADTSTILSPKTKKSNPGKNTVEGVKRAFNPFYVAGNKSTTTRGGSGLSVGPSVSDILGTSAGPSVSDILGQ
jgi:hypothetical protein